MNAMERKCDLKCSKISKKCYQSKNQKYDTALDDKFMKKKTINGE